MRWPGAQAQQLGRKQMIVFVFHTRKEKDARRAVRADCEWLVGRRRVCPEEGDGRIRVRTTNPAAPAPSRIRATSAEVWHQLVDTQISSAPATRPLKFVRKPTSCREAMHIMTGLAKRACHDRRHILPKYRTKLSPLPFTTAIATGHNGRAYAATGWASTTSRRLEARDGPTRRRPAHAVVALRHVANCVTRKDATSHPTTRSKSDWSALLFRHDVSNETRG